MLTIVTTSDESLIRTTIPEGAPGADELLNGYGLIQIEPKTKRANEKKKRKQKLGLN